jgi:molecular chaperone DnaK
MSTRTDRFHIADEFKKPNRASTCAGRDGAAAAQGGSEKAKCELSTSMETTVNLPFITADQAGPKHLQMSITRAKLEDPDRRADAQATAQAVPQGASGRQADRRQHRRGRAGRRFHANPRCADVGQGHLQEASRTSRSTPTRWWVGCGDWPTNELSKGAEDDILLLDVTPLTLGIETLGGVMTPLIERNTTVPHARARRSVPPRTTRPEVTIHVLQGERTEFAAQPHAGPVQPDRHRARRRAACRRSRSTFAIDANGILSVAAKDKATNKSSRSRSRARAV